jgi:TfoX/Sxy family transcriptional regulator of competence genes
MPYSEELAQKVRDHLGKGKKIEEKKMMGGLTFMVNDKMCLGVLEDKLMCRVGPQHYDAAFKRAK